MSPTGGVWRAPCETREKTWNHRPEGASPLRKRANVRCFSFAVLTGLYKNETMHHPNRATHYRHYLLLFSWPKFPVAFPRDVTSFEKRDSISSNLYSYDNGEKLIYPILPAEKRRRGPSRRPSSNKRSHFLHHQILCSLSFFTSSSDL